MRHPELLLTSSRPGLGLAKLNDRKVRWIIREMEKRGSALASFVRYETGPRGTDSAEANRKAELQPALMKPEGRVHMKSDSGTNEES